MDKRQAGQADELTDVILKLLHGYQHPVAALALANVTEALITSMAPTADSATSAVRVMSREMQENIRRNWKKKSPQ